MQLFVGIQLHVRTWFQVIQPTPMMSPCTSEGTLHCPTRPRPPSPLAPRLAPLASISSCHVSTDCPSVGSDSVFIDEELLDTEDEADEFSTDSDVDDYEFEIKRPSMKRSHNPSRVPFAEHLQVCEYPKTLAGRFHAIQPVRRYSSPSHRSDTIREDVVASTPPTTQLPTTSEGMRARPVYSMSCDHLVRALTQHGQQSLSTTDLPHCSWSQETLF